MRTTFQMTAISLPAVFSTRSRKSWLALVATAVGLLGGVSLFAPAAQALYGDNYGAAPINDGAGPLEDAPAYPGNHAVWAGACDRGAAPAPGGGDDLSAIGDGGFGQLPSTILAGTGNITRGIAVPPASEQILISAPRTPEHCIDYGAPSAYEYQDRLWQMFPWSSNSFGYLVGQELPDCQFPTDPWPDAAPPYPAEWPPFPPQCDFAPKWRLPAETAAGAHPDGTTTFLWNRNTEGLGSETGKPDGSVDNLRVDLPPGFVGNPLATPRCSAEQFAQRPIQCGPETQVGILRLEVQGVCFAAVPCNTGNGQDVTYPVYNLEPRHGKVAEVGVGDVASETTIRVVAKARTNKDFGVTAFAAQIPAALVPIAQSITIWGVPWAATNDLWRGPNPSAPGNCSQKSPIPNGTVNVIPAGGYAPVCRVSYDPSWGPIRPFFTSQSECTGSNVTTDVWTDAYQHPGAFTDDGDPDPTDADWKTYSVDSPPVRGCDKLPFDPSASFDPTSTTPDSPSGLEVDITLPQNDLPPDPVATDPGSRINPLDPDSPIDPTSGAPGHWRSDAGRATAQLDKTVVKLPEGMSVNPAAATGLEGCSDDQMGVTAVGNPYTFDNSEPACPEGARIGTVEATTPLLEGSPNLTGEVMLGMPKSTDPTSGEMFRLFLVLRNQDRGLLAKIHGTSIADPATGQITATFDNNPRVPVENINVKIKGGDRGLLAMPQTCGEKTTASQFTPWTAAHDGGGIAKDLTDPFTVGGDCSFGLAPTLAAGMSTAKARANGALSFKIARRDGEQWIDGLTATLPTGLLASVKDVPLCSDADAAAGNCPAGSRIGTVDASAGSGTPFVLERKGDAYLTRGYKGCPYGLMVKVPVEAGPFRGDLALSPIVVRQSVCVDRSDAHVTVVSDPLPIIHHGIPLRMRTVTVNVDRPGFSLNPSDCAAKQIAADFKSPAGTLARATTGFQASGCGQLPFKPKLTMALTGKKQMRTGQHPGIKAQVTQAGVGEAGIEKAVVTLPPSLALDPDNAQALCEFADGTKPDLENHCPKGSIVGRARAISPLLNQPLAGNVYFVKNIRIDPKTGNQIRTLPMIIVALRGEIAVNLRGESSTSKTDRLVNTFNGVPDAPISKFNLNINGGKTGILAVTRTRRARINICTKPKSHRADSDLDAHNGKQYDTQPRLKTPCSAKKRKAAEGRKKKRSAKQRNR